uniref:FAF domain-containing protein n=1 Tax=Setaria italica TaxID=4555 RepID=K4AIH2_SETIT
MALTVFETSEQQQQLLPCQQAVEQAGDGGKAPAAAGGAEKAAVTLKETDRGGDDDGPERADIWNMIQAQKPTAAAAAPKQAQAPYVHPLVRRSSSLLTQKSLEICTESLGSETGSDGFSDADGSSTDRSCPGSDDEREEAVAPRAPPPRAFPPPLPSLARRKVESTMEMRQERQGGRLLVRVVPVPSSTLFRAQRRGGRLLLSFADTAAPAADESRGQVEPVQQADEHDAHEEEEDEDVEEDDDDEEVEVVDRGTVVEFKARSGSGPRVRRSSLVINKFVGAEPAATCEINAGAAPTAPQEHSPKHSRRSTGSTTTAVAALAAASVLSATAPPPCNGEDVVPGATCGENKLLMTAKRRSSKEELLNHMRRCNQLRGQLFFWEPRIATSS